MHQLSRRSTQVSAAVADALDVVMCSPITPSVYTPPTLGAQTWLSGKPEFRAIGLAAG